MASTFAGFVGAGIAAEARNLSAWRERVGARPAVKQVVEPMFAYLKRALG
jgi:glutathione S-transferase